jgi:hypothetical protein
MLNLAGFLRRLKFGVKIILLVFILCYVLPKLLTLFLNFDSPRNIPDNDLREKPLRVFWQIKS